MGKVFSQVETIVKNKFALMETVALIEATMCSRGWNKSKLTKESGASSAAVTRFFQDGMINSENTLKILNALDLIKNNDTIDNSSIYSLPNKFILLHEQLEYICAHGSDEQIKIIKTHFAETVQMINNELMAMMEKMNSKIDKLATDVDELKDIGNAPKVGMTSSLPGKKRST